MDEGRDSESESGSDVEEYSGMEQPPLIKQLKTILAEYPDDGQIIKELVQNAEDAGATEMKILFDGRRLNTDTTKKLPYRKFFKAPALCFYNNAVFSDKDWKGIRMIYSSVKEEDPLKVGRFGLGFKSVFHITDNPCIISGDRILLMNPHDKNPRLVCTTIKLKRLTECKRLKVEEFLQAFSHTFGFSEDCLNTGEYEGTIFWFPLRESASKLSGTCYDGNKVLDLFKSFQSEAVHSLLFLKSLCKAELFCRGSDSEYDLVNGEAFFSLEVGDGHDTSVVDSNLYRERTRFLEEVKTACGQIPSEDIVSVTHPTFRSRYKTTHSSSIEERNTTWVVVNVFKGRTMSNRLRQLVSDKELSYKPYVGAAVPLMKDNMEEEPLKGHIFCFLPLPPEKKSLTGLPVHFNGFFALSQNRRHVKWATDDQEKLNMHLDKSIEWNELLVNEMLPGVYMRLVQELIKVCKDKGNVPDHVAAVYRCIPDGSIVDSKWEGCMNEMFKQLIMNEFIFVSKLSKWVQPNQPLYTMFDRQNISEDQKETVKKLLKVHKNVENTDVPSHIWKLLQRQACPRDVSPAEVCEVIRSEDVYKGAIDTNEKLHLLQYLTKDGKFGLLEGLELLPLQNGSFTTFQSIGDSPSIFCCNKEEIALFPGLEEKFVSNNLPQKLQEITNNLGKYQLRILAVDDMISLLQDTILKNVGDSEPSPLTITTDKRLDVWLENVWMYIFNHFAHVLTRFSHLPLIPCLTSGNWNDSSVANLEIMLFNMFHTFLLKSFTDVEELPDKICDALERMSVKILPSLPKWLDVGRLQCIFTPNTHSIVRMFEQLSKHPEAANMFNSTCTAVDAEALIDLIEKKISTLPASNAMVFLQRLEIFKQKDSTTSDIKTTLTSVTVCDRILSQGVNIPVRFVRPTLISDSYICMSAAKKLGANVINEDDIVSEVLQEMKDTNSYSIDEVYTFMLWILDNIHRFQDKSNLMSLIRNVCFVDNGEDKLKPSELYDPRDSSLLALFHNERKFPVNEFATDAHLNALLLLGLRTKQNLTADCLYMTAKHLDQLCRNGQSRASLEPKAKMLLQTFGERTDLLSSTVRFTCSKLHMSVRQFLCIPHKKERPHGYPEGLGWKGSEFTLCAASELKNIAFSEASGSVIPLVKCNSETVGQMFSWNSRPEAFVLTEQLRNLVANYRSTNKAGILQLITSVYRAMMERTADMTSCPEFQNLLTGKCIWWGDEFCSPGQIVLERRSEDIDVRPYMYILPSELELMKSFFIAVGCHQKQTIPVLLEVLQLIREKHRKHYTMNEHEVGEVGKDLQLVLQILNRLFQEKMMPEHYDEKLFFPIHTEDDTTLVLEPATKCTYCDAQWLKELTDEDDDDEEEILYVHADVPSRVAEGLGVKSLKTQLMSDAIGLEEWGQSEPLTTRLHNIVKEGYQDGLAVPKEIIQNADDARATTVILIYDERENADSRTQLLDEGMASCQGPALWAYNDGLFSDDDLKNITKLSGATKESDTTKIGKFGLGFCAVYNLTDVPSFVSGQNMVIFDPHTTHLNKALPGESPGLRIDLKNMKNKRLMKKMHNQFKPFQNVLGCDLYQKDPYFNGTLFRLPLRTKQQATVSEIKRSSYSRKEMIKLLKQLVETSGNLLLFTQNVSELKLYHIPQSGVSPDSANLICTVTREIASQKFDRTILDICSDMKIKKALHLNPFETVQRVCIRIQNTKHMRILSNAGESVFETNWLVSWATGVSKSLQLSCGTNVPGALPLGSVAVLVKSENGCAIPESMRNCTFGFYKAGHLFCYLPLPIQSNVEFHVNGSFAVTSTRRGLQTNTEDDKYSYNTQWNEALLSDTIARSFINLLVCLQQLKTTDDYKFHQLWPTSTASLTEPLRRGFYDSIVLSNHAVFESYGRWLGINQCIFLNRNMSQDPDIEESALSTLQRFRLDENKGVVKVPLIYMNELEKTKGWNEKANVVSDEEFFTKYFLPNISETYWHESDHNVSCRNKLLLYCLSHTTPNISTLLRKSDCIPTDPGDKLRKPSDLVHPKGRAAILFEIGDGRFPERNFRKNSIARKLLDLGMMKDTLTSEIVIDRATSVQSLALQGFLSQALQRCHHLIEYLTSSRNVDQPTLKQLGCINFLPVLKKPTDWPFAWHADILFEGKNNDRKICFEKASCLFLDDCQKLVGCTKLILDSSRFPYSYNSQLLIQMGINAVSNVKLESTVEQLLVISKTKDKKKDFAEKRVEEAVVEKLYEYMNKCATDDIGTFQREIKPLENRNIILFESELIPVSKVAFSIGYNCIPELYEIGRNKLSKYKHFLRGVGVKEHVQVQDVVGILQRKRLQFDANSLPPNELQLILQLLELLSVLMHNVHLRYQDIRHLGQDNIVAPDTDVILRPTTMLCLDDMNFKEASKSMRFVHSSISRTVAESIGITTKKRKFLQDCSKGIPFEQKEELVTRLKGLLDGYPCDIGVMKELIQNADDANASEIHFIKDFRTHGCNKVFDNFKEFQGPALLVFDDSGFSKANLQGLQKLGVGSKKVDQAKTGQYGVGFNAVYNLTDLPSFITKGPEIEEGETLCILDPLQKHNDEHCGMRYNLKEVRKAFPDVIAGYSESLFNGKSKGSMFRFPLRRKKTDLGSRVSTKTINTILNTLKTEMAELLLFLRSVSKISVSDISSGTLRTEFSVHVELSEHDLAQRSLFSRCCQDKAKEISRCCQDKAKETGKTEHFKALSPPMQVTYKLHAKDSAMKEQAFVIVQRLGIDENRITPKVKDAIQMGMLGTLPIGGVAVPVLKKDEYLSKISDYMQNVLNRDLAVQRQGNYKIYCFLPLPMASGLPMHINGHFVLDHEARRSLWMEEEGYKSEWNSLILDDIVARSYIGALQCLKSEIFDSSSRGVTKDKFVGFVSLFAKYFPISKKANSKYEKRLIQSIFETIINDRVELFPVGIPDQIAREQEPTHYRIDWSSYLPEGHQFPIYCSSIRSSDSYPLEDLLKTLGLKITLLTKEVNGSMKDSGFSVSCLTPNVVMKFLISFTSESIDRLQIGQLPSPVVETKFVDAGNVERLLSYCSKEPTFKNELNGLPLLVTNDGILQCFDRNKMIYCTTFCDLWPNSSAKFVHIDLVTQVCSLDIGVCNGVKANVSVNEVDELLAAEIDREVYNRDDMADLHNISSMCGYKWIRSLWNMLTDGFHDANTNEHKVDFLTYLQPLQHWCLVPAITYNKRHVLVKVNNVDTVISSGHFERSPMLKRALKKLQLPELTSVCLSEEATKQISTCVASIENPVALLICLKYYKANFTLTRLTREDCTEISKYFSFSLAAMKMNNRAEAWWIRESLKSLPIFLTLAGTSVSIENDETNVLVLPESMPSDGIREWADQTNRILLQGSVFLEQLYMFLEFKFTNSIYIYINHLLPTWQHLPVNAIKRHFEYIRDMLLRTGVSKNYDDQQLRLMEVLKHTAIIPRKNELLKASVFFSPTNKVFKLFQRKEEFLPPKFSGPEWRKFFEMIGIKTEVTSEMFIAYSQQICQDGSRNITKELKRKSVAMLECLLKQSLKWKWDVCDQISKIKFIIPHTASDMHTEIHKQCTENQTLICFAGSIQNRYEDLTWTSLPLLPNEADPYSYNDVYNYQAKQTLELLHIHQEPTLDSVVLHCQNVCDSLKVCLSDVTVKDRICSWVPSFMENLYRYLQSNGLSSIIKQRLYNTPIVFLPDHKTLVPAHQTIITILPDQEIWPYLVKVPTTYGKFSDLFMHLGASENPGYMLYVKVLAQIKREIGDDVMENGTYMAEWLAITSAVNNLFKNINDSTWKDSLPEDTVLYLPTRGRQLVASSSVTVCDNRDKEGRLHDFEDIQYFTGFKELGLHHTLPGINYLPEQVRPKFLTQIVREEVDVSAVVEVPDSEEARKLEHFFQSTEFIEAVLRLLKHAKSRRMERLTNVEEARVSAELQSIHVQCVTGLRTYLYVKTKRIDASVQERKCFYHQRDDQWLIYFMKSSGNQQEWLRSIDEFLVRFIMDIAGSLSDNSIVIYKMLHMINSTAGLSLLLDQMNIDAYDLPQDISFSIFPPPGTYVPVELHHLLSCELTKIGVHEYKCVAFELEDELIDDTEVSDAYNPVYIYVRITKKVSQDDETSVISEMYEIDTGNELITVPLFKLYRFFRISSDVASRELVSTDEANQSVSPEKMNKEKYAIRFYLQKAWKLKEKTDRKRVIGRLLRRYHPDRNLGNEVMCNELFVYLRQCISELEGGNSLDNEDETDWQPPPKRAYPDFASSQYYSFVEQMSNRSQRQRVHIQEYYRNKQSTYGYMRYTFNFTHSKSSYKAFHDNKEAKRWYRQAKVDLRNAIDTFNTPGEPPAFNWICYMCHQASEKALKAAWFAKDANKVPRQSHDLCMIVLGLGNSNLSQCAAELTNLLGEHTKMRYPDVLSRPNIPSTVFTKQQAEGACAVARRILSSVDEEYLG